MKIELVAVVFALMEAVKRIPVLSPAGRRWILPWIAIALGVGLVLMESPTPTPSLALEGIVLGLAAMGLYSKTLGGSGGPAASAAGGPLPK